MKPIPSIVVISVFRADDEDSTIAAYAWTGQAGDVEPVVMDHETAIALAEELSVHDQIASRS